eukprot:scaffold35866_cov124-Isochrysis_galbana.AAC.10
MKLVLPTRYHTGNSIVNDRSRQRARHARLALFCPWLALTLLPPPVLQFMFLFAALICQCRT